MMRLPRLNSEFRLIDKIKLRMMKLMSGQPAPDVVKLHFYRYGFFGKHAGAMFQEAMRGPSEWNVFDREIMAAFVSQLKQCVF